MRALVFTRTGPAVWELPELRPTMWVERAPRWPEGLLWSRDCLRKYRVFRRESMVVVDPPLVAQWAAWGQLKDVGFPGPVLVVDVYLEQP